MAAGESAKALIAYWIPFVGIGKKDEPKVRVVVPLEGILDFRRTGGAPQVTMVILGAAKFRGTPQTFAPPYLDLSDIASVLTPKTSDDMGPVRRLQAQGIKVLLSVMGPNVEHGMGWCHVAAAKNEAFAQWVKTEVLDAYGLDGIDIDDEFSGWETDPPQALVDTVAALKVAAPDALLHKALWDDDGAFKTPVSTKGSPWQGAYLCQLLDLGSTMAYGYDAAGLESTVASYTEMVIERLDADGKPTKLNVGLSPAKLCIGVQAGEKNEESTWKTTLDDTEAASKWVVENGYRGMMLYTFTSDILQWTREPQNDPRYLYPNPDDHEWQRRIAEAMQL